MSGEWNDERIQKAFAEWRAREMADAPPFDRAYAEAKARATIPRRMSAGVRRWAAVAAAILLATGAASLLLRSRTVQSPLAPRGTISLSEWRSPTAFLLHGPGEALISTVPNFSGASTDLNALGVRTSHRRPI